MATTVREIPQLSVDVSELLRRAGASTHLRARRAVGGLSLPLAAVREGSTLGFDLRLDALVDGIHVSGSVSGEVVMECRRCTRHLRREVRVEVSQVYLYPGEGPSDGDAYQIERERIDLEPMIRDEVVLALPLNPVCREDCAGLCPQCGTDRNEVQCEHGGYVDIRWGPLERLRERMEE